MQFRVRRRRGGVLLPPLRLRGSMTVAPIAVAPTVVVLASCAVMTGPRHEGGASGVQNDRIDGDPEFVETYTADEVDDKGERVRVQRTRYKARSPCMACMLCRRHPQHGSLPHGPVLRVALLSSPAWRWPCGVETGRTVLCDVLRAVQWCGLVMVLLR